MSTPGNLELVPTILVEESPNVGVWDWKINIGCVILSETDAALFENAGFGVLHRPPQSFSGEYPQKTMQYMASYGTISSESSVLCVEDLLSRPSFFPSLGIVII